MKNHKHIVTIGVLLALSLIFAYLEMILPSFLPNPAFKIGLSQIPILLTFYLFDLKSSAAVSTGKVLMMSLLFGYFLTYIFFVNLSGAIFSILFIGLSQQLKFSIPMTSLMSSLGHNLGQFIIIGFTLGWNIALFYLPVIIVFSVLFGLIIGLISQSLLNKIEKRI
ncbi:MAG: Gx transporter family protein [Firmicutes bacterium]|nr:Gx transporter family protein [Bacillota bacterium]